MGKVKEKNLTAIVKHIEAKYGDISIGGKSLNEGAPNSRVYKFTVKKTGEEKILKVLTPKFSKKRTYEREKTAMEKHTVKEVIKFDNTGIINGVPFFIFPFVKGDTLRELISKRKFTEKEITDFILKMIGAIKKLDVSGVVHQDIKPANIIYRTYKDFVILDLGIALFNFTDPTYKKGKGPLHYLSPEMIDLCNTRSANNQYKISYTSDLYSLGIIGVEMITNKRINNLIPIDKMHEAPKYINKIKASNRFKNLISILLDSSPSVRILKLNKLHPGITEKLKVNIDTTLWTQEYDKDTFNSYVAPYYSKKFGVNNLGLIVSGDVVQNENNLINLLGPYQKKGLKLMVDPRTMRLDNKNKGYLAKRRYASRAVNLIREVLNFEKKFNPDYYIAPYYYVSNINDPGLEDSIKSYEEFIKQDKKVNSSNTYFGIVLRDGLIKDHVQLKELIDIINFNNKIKRVYVLFETKMETSTPNKDKDSISGINMFINLVGLRKEVFWSLSDITALYMLGDGLSNFSICPTYSNRKNDFDRFNKDGGPIKNRHAKIFSPQLMNEILLKVEMEVKTAVGTPKNNELKYTGHFFNQNLNDEKIRKSHFLEFVADYKKKIKALSNEDAKRYFIARLDGAEKIYSIISGKYSIKFSPVTDGSFVNIWKSVFKN